MLMGASRSALELFCTGSFPFDGKLRGFLNRFAKTGEVALDKAVAHLEQPDTYPLSPDPNSMEKILSRYIARLPPRERRGATAVVMPRLRASAAERQRIYGDLAAINLRSAQSVEQQLIARPVPAQLTLAGPEIERLQNLLDPTRRSAVSRTPFSQLSLCVSQITCVEKTRVLGELDFQDELVLDTLEIAAPAGALDPQ